MRGDPFLQAKIIGLLTAGQRVVCMAAGRLGGWWRFRPDGLTGWALRRKSQAGQRVGWSRVTVALTVEGDMTTVPGVLI